MRTRRKDNFVMILATLWLLVNSIVFCIFGVDCLWISNTFFIVALVAVLLNNRLMKWFNKR